MKILFSFYLFLMFHSKYAQTTLGIVAYGGATPNDFSDDRAAIQKTIDAVHAAGGGTVTIPAGTFLVSTAPDASPIQVIALNIYSNITLKGVGPESIIKLKDNNGNYDALLGIKPSWDIVDNFRMNDLTIDGNGANNLVSSEVVLQKNGSRSCLRIYKGKNIEVENYTFINVKGVWVLVFNGFVEHVKVQNNVFKNIGDDRVDWDHSTIYTNGDDFIIANNQITSLHGAGTLGARAAIEIHGSNQVVSHNNIDGMTYGVNVTGYSSWYQSINQIYYRNTFRNVMSDFAFWSEIDGSENRSVACGLENVLVEDNLIEANPDGWAKWEHFNGGSGFFFEQNRTRDIDRVFIIKNKVIFKKSGGLSGEFTSKVSGLVIPANNIPTVKVKNLYFLDNIVENSYGSGVYLNDAIENFVFAHNTLQNCGSSKISMYDAFKSGVFLSGKLYNVQFTCNSINDVAEVQSMKQMFANYSYNAGNCIVLNNASDIASIALLNDSSESSGLSWSTVSNKPILSFETDRVVLKKGDVNTSLRLLLSKASNSKINVRIYVLDNTAKMGRDFVISQKVIAFLPGQTSKYISITALDNTLTTQNKNATLVIRYDASVVAGCKQYAKLILEP